MGVVLSNGNLRSRASIVAGLASAPRPNGSELLAVSEIADWLEVRADLAGDLGADWIRSFFPGRLLYSLRSAPGGTFEGTQVERTSRLLDAARHYDLVELNAACDFQPDLLNRIPAKKRMLSWYGQPMDYNGLLAAFERMSSVEGSIYKIVLQGSRIGSALDALRLLKTLGRSDVVAFASGAGGLWSRVIAPHFGAPMVFASAKQEASPEDDPPVFQLVEDYGLPFLSAVTEVYGIVGNPVSHSLSPRIHNAAYRAIGYPALFVPFQVDSFAEFWREIVDSPGLEALGLSIRGLTVASPCKEVALREAGVTSSMSRRVGATNVFVRENGHWRADTTDPQCVLPLIRNKGFSVEGKKAAVVGCGGAGRAVAAALEEAGADVTLVNRGLERGRIAVRFLGMPFVPLSSFAAHGFSILVNATPVGRDDDSLPFNIEGLSTDAAVVDLVYGSKPTPLVNEARASGRVVIDGKDVLLAQVLRQFRLMTGMDMPSELVQQYSNSNGRLASNCHGRTIMKQMKYVKAEDRVEASADKTNGEAFDLKPLLGIWVNTNSATRGMAKVILTARGSNLNVRVFGLSNTSPGDWGEIKADSVHGNSLTSGQASAFTASYGFDVMHTDLLANLSQGLLILAAFSTFTDGSERSNYFAREFFHRLNGDSNGEDRAMRSLTQRSAEEQAKADSAPKHAAVEVGPLLGSWVNTNGGTRGITKADFEIREDKFVARLFGVCDPSPCDWGEVSAYPFAKDVRSSELAGISLSYDFGFMETRMQAHVKQGVLVIAKFDRFRDDSGRSNSFSREFFYRPDA